ncbi:MAG: hypothetical protein J7J91_06850 [Deltaproteobacteria bacterium]|nr:hypothetical protein [Deltaproteobacteria bacterium]
MIVCGVCGLEFKNEEDYEKHLFHYKLYRWCGVKVLRIIEQNEESFFGEGEAT